LVTRAKSAAIAAAIRPGPAIAHRTLPMAPILAHIDAPRRQEAAGTSSG